VPVQTLTEHDVRPEGTTLPDRLTRRPITARDGIARILMEPGLGIHLNEDALERCAINSLAACLHSSWLDGTALTPFFRPLLSATS